MKNLYDSANAIFNDKSATTDEKRLKIQELIENSGIDFSLPSFDMNAMQMLKSSGIDPSAEWLNVVMYELKASAFPEDIEFLHMDEWEAHYWLTKLCSADSRLHMYEDADHRKFLCKIGHSVGGGTYRIVLTSLPYLDLSDDSTWVDVLKALCNKNNMLNKNDKTQILEFHSISELEMKLSTKGII